MRRLLGLSAFAFLALATGVATLPPASAARPLGVAAANGLPTSLRRFFSYQRPPSYASERIQVAVPMRDGMHLGCYLYQPSGSQTGRRFPGIIDNFTPYYLAYPFAAFNGTYFAERGYLDLECTPRGTGLSEGTFGGWLSAIENSDNYDLIEWLVHQPNSTGKVAQEGDSYGGMTAYRVAALHPPGLVTIAPQQSYSSLYLEYDYPGGIRSLGDPYWYLFAGAVGVVRPSLSPQELAWLQHPLLDAYWQQIDLGSRLAQIHLPILGFGGWVDIFQDGMARNYVALKGPTTYLIEGPWTHGSTFDSTVTVGTLLAWFDHWLYDDPNAPLPPTHVTSYVMPNGPWQDLSTWPADHVRNVLSMTTSGSLSSAPGARGGATYLVNTAAGSVDLPGDHLTFTGPPLQTPETISGAPVMTLIATMADNRDPSASVDTNFVLHLYDVTASGSKTLITRGYLKASHYQSQAHPSRIPPGEPIEYSIPLWNVSYRIAAGDHLLLLLESGEQSCCLSGAPALVQPLMPLAVTVSTGIAGSSIDIPITTP